MFSLTLRPTPQAELSATTREGAVLVCAGNSVAISFGSARPSDRYMASSCHRDTANRQLGGGRIGWKLQTPEAFS
jgi:hypothetical protein